MRIVKIGRKSYCDIIYDNNLISAEHAEIRVDNNRYFLTDFSTNGTSVKGRPLEKNREVEIQRGDAVLFADTFPLDWNRIPTGQHAADTKTVYGIGSDFHNQIRLNDPSERVSRFHATLTVKKDGKMYLTDHSTNGTYVNGIRISKNIEVPVKKKKDTVTFGKQMPLDWNLIKEGDKRPEKLYTYIAAALSAAIAIVCLVWWFHPSPKPDLQTLISQYKHAVVLVHQDYVYSVEFDEIGIPYYLLFTQSSDGVQLYGIASKQGGEILSVSSGDPISISGSGFLVSKDGKIVTNRHVSYPWEEDEVKIQTIISDWLNNTRKQLGAKKELFNSDLGLIISNILHEYPLVKIKAVSGKTLNLRIGYCDRYYESYNEFEPCIKLRDTKNRDVDLAMIQLNSKRIPEGIPTVFDLANVLPSTEIKEGLKLVLIGYPMGPGYTLNNETGGLKTDTKFGAVSSTPGPVSFRHSIPSIGGASGSPIIDEQGRLVGVLNAGYMQGGSYNEAILGAEVTKLCKQYE